MKQKVKLHQKAHLLRKRGISIRTIAKNLKISSSTASLWCRDIELSEDQRAKLEGRGARTDLLRVYAQERHEDKIQRHNKILNEAIKDIERLNRKELFLFGVALYWAEGFKSIKEQQVGFCNSDPLMIKLILKWFQEILHISKEEFVLRAEFNIKHKDRLEEIENYWSELTGIPRSQFNKPYFQKTVWNRDYSNEEKYYGILRIKIRRSSELLVKIRGWIQGTSKFL